MQDKKAVMEIDGRQVFGLKNHLKNPSYRTEKQQVFIIGAKGIPANYGGFETFVEKLTEHQKSDQIRYHVARMGNSDFRFEYNGAKCFNLKVPHVGAARAIFYDMKALRRSIAYCKARPCIEKPIFYVLACRIGPVIHHYKKQIEKLGGVLYLNPDGHEWKRAKWSAPIRLYWKISESLMIKNADLVICDSKVIEKYIHEEYAKYKPNTTYIAYGSEVRNTEAESDTKLENWYNEKKISAQNYYLIVARFVPENNFETIIREFMASNTKKSLVIVATSNSDFFSTLEQKLHFSTDERIKFVGSVYDSELLKQIRGNAYGYIHGHEVGGTNPSLLESLGNTNLNLLLDVAFNREVGEDAALYWTKQEGSLRTLIAQADVMDASTVNTYGQAARNRITQAYTWQQICEEYEKLFLC